jgi:hypothetical protein
MFLKTGDYQGLISELQNVRNKDFSQKQSESLVQAFSGIPWQRCFWIIRNITRQPNLPNNLYGVVLNQIEEEKYRNEKKDDKNGTWDAGVKCVTPHQWELGMAIIAMLCMMDDKLDNLKRFAENMEENIRMDQLDYFLEGSYKVITECNPETKLKYDNLFN